MVQRSPRVVRQSFRLQKPWLYSQRHQCPQRGMGLPIRLHPRNPRQPQLKDRRRTDRRPHPQTAPYQKTPKQVPQHLLHLHLLRRIPGNRRHHPQRTQQRRSFYKCAGESPPNTPQSRRQRKPTRNRSSRSFIPCCRMVCPAKRRHAFWQNAMV